MNNGEPSREVVHQELAELRQEAKKYTLKELKSGVWFPQLLRHALDSYVHKVDARYFEEKYPNLNRDAIVDRRIALAKQYAALAGGMSASAYSAAVVATLGTKGGASPLTVPAAVGSFAADLFFVTRLQLRLAYDLSVLYDHPINLDDPEDLMILIRVAFGVKAGEELHNAAAKFAPELVRQSIKKTVTGQTLRVVQALPYVGKYLLQRNIIKMAIPGVSIPLGAGLNYYITGRVAGAARRVFRDRAVIDEAAPGILGDGEVDALLLLQVVWLMIRADGSTSAEETWFLSALADGIEARDGGDELLDRFRTMTDCDEAEILQRLSQAPPDEKRQIYEASCLAAALDHKFHRKEKKQLQRIAETCGLPYEPDEVGVIIERFGA